MSIIDFQNQKTRADEAKAKQEQDTRNRAVWERDILPNYDVLDNQANFNLAVDYANGDLTLARFQFMLQNNPNHGLVFGDQRQDLLEQIQDLITDNFHRTLQPADIKYRMGKYVYQNRMELRASLQQLQAAKEARAKSVGELRQEVRNANKPAERPYPGYPTLLSTLTPRGSIQSVNSRDYLNHIAQSDKEEFHRYVRIYSSRQIDDIRMGKRYE